MNEITKTTLSNTQINTLLLDFYHKYIENKGEKSTKGHMLSFLKFFVKHIEVKGPFVNIPPGVVFVDLLGHQSKMKHLTQTSNVDVFYLQISSTILFKESESEKLFQWLAEETGFYEGVRLDTANPSKQINIVISDCSQRTRDISINDLKQKILQSLRKDVCTNKASRLKKNVNLVCNAEETLIQYVSEEETRRLQSLIDSFISFYCFSEKEGANEIIHSIKQYVK